MSPEHLGLPEGSIGGLAYDALMMARDAKGRAESVAQAQDSHEEVCAERYKNINEKLGMLFKIIAWAGGSAFAIVMGLLAFLAKTQFDQIKTLQSAVGQRTELLERAQPVAPQIIIQRAPGQTTDMGATVERQQHP